jgi:hypothetical protein
MEKLDNNEIDVNQANAMSKLIGQASNLLNYELKRAVLMANPDFKDEHRNLEQKYFDSLPEPKRTIKLKDNGEANIETTS